MRERPILFSAPMVRALLDGSKTQTRRIVKGLALEWLAEPVGFTPDYVADPANQLCPFGQPGDRLWVRETFAQVTIGYAYAADPIYNSSPAGKWTPSIHMPRAASRIDLEVTEVRVERLQEISEPDAIAEGIEQMPCPVQDTRLWRNYDPSNGWTPSVAIPQNSFRSLWSSINSAGSWDANLWVWVVEFRRVRP